jgi:hypothetical protein
MKLKNEPEDREGTLAELEIPNGNLTLFCDPERSIELRDLEPGL